MVAKKPAPKTAVKEPKRMGRPPVYTDELADLICHRIATSTDGLKKICSLYDDMPGDDVIYEWRYKDINNFSSKYNKAKSAQAELMAEELDQLCMEVPTHFDNDGVERIDSGMMARQRLLIDTRKWYASKLAPKIYGDKLQVEDNTDKKRVVKSTAEKITKAVTKKKREY